MDDKHAAVHTLDLELVQHAFASPRSIAADYNLCARCAAAAARHHCGEVGCCGPLPPDWDGFRYPD